MTSTARRLGLPSTTHGSWSGPPRSVISNSTCRQTPHGAVSASASSSAVADFLPVIAMPLNRRMPIAFARTTAERSAQIVGPYAAFSTFVPVMCVPSSMTRHAPTANPEYGL